MLPPQPTLAAIVAATDCEEAIAGLLPVFASVMIGGRVLVRLAVDVSRCWDLQRFPPMPRTVRIPLPLFLRQLGHPIDHHTTLLKLPNLDFLSLSIIFECVPGKVFI